MSTRNGQAVPGTDKELQPALDQATAPHRPERAPRSAISYGNPSPHDLQTGAEIELAQSPHDSSTIVATYECDPGQYFRQGIGHPGRRPRRRPAPGARLRPALGPVEPAARRRRRRHRQQRQGGITGTRPTSGTDGRSHGGDRRPGPGTDRVAPRHTEGAAPRPRCHPRNSPR